MTILPIIRYGTMKYIYIIISFLFLTGPLFSLNTNLSIGGSAGWEKIETWTNVELIEGKKGYTSLGLKSAEYHPDYYTDLLIHFDDSEIIDSTGNYTVKSKIENTSIEKSIGNGSGVFRGNKESITLHPNTGSIFSGEDVLDNFSIEFWLNPSRFSENPIIISYQGVLRDGKGNLIPQELTCSMENRALNWTLKNIFYTEERDIEIELKGLSPIIPNVWHHHLFRFSGSSGLIEYLVDGQLEAVQYASKTGTEDGTIFFPLISSLGNNHITIGDGYIGYMDELRISKAYIQNPVLKRYQDTSGSVLSQIIDLSRSSSILKKITVEHEIPKDSAIFFHYNISNNLETMFEDTNWVDFYPPEIFISKNKGRYLRIKMDIQTDGEETRTASLSELNIIYEKNLKPLAPAYLHIIEKENTIIIKWPEMSEPDIRGYLIYYGTKKGIYSGSAAKEGRSPLVVLGKEITSITINGLENENLYHFAIAAYDDAGTAYPGVLSEEVTGRPADPGRTNAF